MPPNFKSRSASRSICPTSRFHQCLLLAFAVVLGCLSPAGAQVAWQWRAPVAAGHDLNSVAYGSGKFVAVGQGWMTSADGETWEDQGMFPEDGKNPTIIGMAEVAYGNGYFVAVGSQGRIFRSLHGNGWTAVTLPTTFLGTNFANVTFGKGIWVITTQNEIYVSTNDCQTITKVTLPAANQLSFASVRYGAGPTGSGQFVAVGSVQKTVSGIGPYSYAAFFSSNDGVNWVSFEEGTPIHSFAVDVVWDGLFNKWLTILGRAFGSTAEYWSSDNGVLWTYGAGTALGGNYPTALSYGEGRVAAVGREQGFQSTSLHADGWAFVQGPAVGSLGHVPYAGEYIFTSLTYSEDLGRWVAVGLGGQIAWCDAPLLWHLGVSKERRAVDVGRALGDFYALDPLRISRSSDSVTWETVFDANFVGTLQVPNPPAPGEPLATYGPYGTLFRGLGTSPNQLVAVGRQGRIFTSTTGSAWASEDNWFDSNNVMARVRSIDLNHAARGPLGGWVVVGTEGFIGSTAADGSGLWVVRESNTLAELRRVIHTGTNYVAVGSAGRIVVSDNGTHWIDRSPAGTTQTFTALAVSGSIPNPVLVASGASALFTSHDHGQTWVQRPLPLTSPTVQQATALTAVCWSGSEFVGTGPRGVVLVSPDGINWAVRQKGATFGSRSQAIAFDGSTYVLAAGGLLSSPSRVVGPLHSLNITAVNGTVTRFPNLPSYETGTLVKLTAQPAPGYQFSSWSGFPLEFFPTMYVEMNASRNITANFTLIPPNFSSIVKPGSSVSLSTFGSWPWSVEQAAGPSGSQQSVARSGLPSPSFNTSPLSTFLSGAGTLKFQWKVSTSQADGELSFRLAGVRQTGITGVTGWQQVSIPLGEGFHDISWTYRPSSSGGAFADAGFLTDVEWIPGANVPTFTSWANALPAGKRGELDRNGPLQIENLIAYACGIDPLTATSDKLPVLAGKKPSGARFVRYTKREGLADATLVFEYSTNPATLAPAGPAVTQTKVSTQAGVETWEAVLPIEPGGEGFFRLSATRNP